jgi:aspartate racemase
MPKHIGIAACSAEGAALCYRTICVEGPELLGGHAHPEISMHTPSLEEYMQRVYRGDWESVGEMLLASARKLAGMGADFVICPDNTLHQALPHILARSPLPWLHIADAVMAEATARGYRHMGLSGTRWLMEGPVYPKKLLRPDAAERKEMNCVIMDELVRGVCKPEAVTFFQRVYGRMKDAGCEAVVMGCTEIPLVMSDANSPLPTLDSTRLLARAALRKAIGYAGSSRP